MCAHAGKLSILKNQDLICIADGADTLGNNDTGCVRTLFIQFFTQDTVGLVIKSGERVIRVIENQDFRFAGNGSGNGKTLFLTAGEVAAKLGDVGIIGAVHLLNKF